MDGTESVRSGRSERSERSQAPSHRSHGSRHHHRHNNRDNNRDSVGRHSTHSGHSGYRNRSMDRDRHRERDRDRDDRSVTIKAPGNVSGDEMIPGTEEERIEVQILPQDDNWGDNTTAITGNTSETAFSVEDMHKFQKDMDVRVGFECTQYFGTIMAGILSMFGFVSPIIMVVLPKLGIDNWSTGVCLPDCEGLLISFAFKLLILLLGALALFFRRPKSTMPRVFVFRALVLFLVFVLTFAFWLFYGVRIFKEKMTDYKSIVMFAVSLVDALLFIHYLAVILLEIRQLQPQFTIKVVRSPDGESRNYNLGVLSIQRAAVWVLEQYYRDFHVYNQYLDNLPRSRSSKMTGFKFYNVDGVNPPAPGEPPQGRSRAVFAAAARRRDASHNDRFYEEQEYERRVRKRKARLIVASDEAFTHIKRMQEEQGGQNYQGSRFYWILDMESVDSFTSVYVVFKSLS